MPHFGPVDDVNHFVFDNGRCYFYTSLLTAACPIKSTRAHYCVTDTACNSVASVDALLKQDPFDDAAFDLLSFQRCFRR